MRESNPHRIVRLPPDRRLIVSIHSYDPFDFTHQGEPWRDPVRPTGRGCCDTAQRRQLQEPLDTAVAWSQAQGVPLHLGEFGAFNAGAMEARAAYAHMVREAAEARGVGWPPAPSRTWRTRR